MEQSRRITSRPISKRIASHPLNKRMISRLVNSRIMKSPVSGQKSLKNNKGQFAIEAILLTVVLVGVFALAVKFLRDGQYIQKLTNDSVGKVKNLSEYGTWKPVCKAIKGSASQTAANCHPNSINRALSSDPQ